MGRNMLLQQQLWSVRLRNRCREACHARTRFRRASGYDLPPSMCSFWAYFNTWPCYGLIGLIDGPRGCLQGHKLPWCKEKWLYVTMFVQPQAVEKCSCCTGAAQGSCRQVPALWADE
jgi:hypothetical protein